MEFSFPNWDGYGALPVSQASVEKARKLIDACIAGGLPEPDVSSEPDGAVVLEWYVHPRCLVSVSIDGEKEFVSFSALYQHDLYRGKCSFDGKEVPGELKTLVQSIYNRA